MHKFLEAINTVEDYTVDLFVDEEGNPGHGRDSNLNGIIGSTLDFGP